MKRAVTSLACLVALTACAGAPAPGPSSPNAPATSTAPQRDATQAALALVREGAKPVTAVSGSAPAVTSEGSLAGSTLHVFEVRATEQSTTVTFALTHPSGAAFDDALYHVSRWAPIIKVGDSLFHPTRTLMYRNETASMALVGQPHDLAPEPRPLFASFPALPAGTTQVQVISPITEEPIPVPVTRDQEPLPQGTGDIPILGRVTYLDPNNHDEPDPVTVTVHGVRRVQDATVLYYSATRPQGSAAINLARFGGGTTVLDYSVSGRKGFTEAVGVIDNTGGFAYGPVYDAYLPQVCAPSTLPVDDQGATLCWAVLPRIDTATTRVDVLIGGHQLIQDVPVEDGALTPTVAPTDSKQPLLGQGWPEIPASALALARDAEQIERSQLPLRTVIKQDAITTSGEQLDLDTTVLFAYNEATLTSEATSVLAKAAEQITSFNRPGQLTVTGHTDSDGPDAHNRDLSQRRAQAVADALAPLLGSGYTFKVEGKGEADPIASNDTDTGRQLNRRVTILPPQ